MYTCAHIYALVEYICVYIPMYTVTYIYRQLPQCVTCARTARHHMINVDYVVPCPHNQCWLCGAVDVDIININTPHNRHQSINQKTREFQTQWLHYLCKSDDTSHRVWCKTNSAPTAKTALYFCKHITIFWSCDVCTKIVIWNCHLHEDLYLNALQFPRRVTCARTARHRIRHTTLRALIHMCGYT